MRLPLTRGGLARAFHMLEVGLCMTVKNEAHNVVACLGDIKDLFAQIVVIDTGSTDGTPDILADRLGLSAYRLALDESRCNALADVRNEGFGMLTTPWLMTLDADERIAAPQLAALFDQDDADLPAGLCCGWDTDFGDGAVIYDYKLALFRSHHRHCGLVHDTAQPSLRLAGEVAGWSDHMRILHFPDADRWDEKEVTYARRLSCAIRRDPDWLRYFWFSGYQAYRRGDPAAAAPYLQALHDKRPPLFPVESLNASMVLAAIEAQRGDRGATLRVIGAALEYHRDVADDFEVGVNPGLAPWLRRSHALAEAGRLADIVPPRFPY